MHIGVISLFPDMFSAITEHGVTRRAIKEDLLTVSVWNPRDFTHDKHRTVDDRPYGGGPGMLMMVQPLVDAINAAKAALGEDTPVIYLSPQGQTLDHGGVTQLAQNDRMILIAGRYEGIDQRVIDQYVDAEWSIGDYVLSGGELPAMVLIDAVARMVPGVLGHQDSAAEDSFANGLLDCPHYTRPETYNGQQVPTVLLSGNHEKIRQWRLQQALGKTWLQRKELINRLALTDEQEQLLNEFIQQQESED
ncbi:MULTISPECIES: tRNA (guanosine(37)-N1)-methyltransferase TrmD [Idiomarina]|jgi:tRNA (guanine37-N1)-methyltransferase|uniref:tRNA (guanine-N(1)-)-methyltransferase n=2 Tax=Idiomarina baltica TaxID=190892 RepID=A0A348WMY6_9GAMM|nr:MULTISPECIES: tRNA (guanosine(37)-N1)-methyltransferase TrmD [Idiomarina]MAF74335.1 tRNA (guanosine(37)-N1)-methyltransferase TrmD [Idiomarinaceae bacterium]MEC8924936.1 tRNA (guanosine(37)-N1)-methyltransferase TrmD [Pseudomonadota bacterium]HAR55898.1 tRNA (guanosine(37)-N1)-methyltransferase TrmD [Idiomarina baltica]EAQ31689.1 tRNA (guanine-N(1)-)-methyltransferase [Idiomarina baltica OS145]MBR36982.1 tRNA (guanosine(37)-N1)-methyltransferase TrmD [Idiomarina sp.]|tara:strand:- start:40 stop:786 length:747 start_codon:yes stop_codon:yes gene_type:complete